MKTTIRKARGADVDALSCIARAAKQHWGYPETLMRLWAPDLTVTAQAVASDPVYCAVRGWKIVGFYAVSQRGKTYELEHMWVDPRSIGNGVGRRLLEHLLRLLGKRGGRRLRIASDPNAEGCYLRLGARRIGSVASKPRGRRLPLLAIDVKLPAARMRRQRADLVSHGGSALSCGDG